MLKGGKKAVSGITVEDSIVICCVNIFIAISVTFCKVITVKDSKILHLLL